MRLVARLRADRGIELPLRALFAHPSPRSLARDLATAAAEKMGYDPLLPLQTHGSERPLFCVHPAGGSSTVFANIANLLPDELPVYGMQAKALSDPSSRHSSVREMADCYVNAMRNVQAKGPYRLLGWSFGGVILQEMAAQLAAEGETLEIGILLDSPLSGDDFSEPDHKDKVGRLTEYAEALGIFGKDLSEEAIKEAILLAAKREGVMPAIAEINDVDMMLEIMQQAPTLMASWTGCPRLSAAIAFIRASDNARTDLQDRLSQLTTGLVQIFDVPATHNTMCDKDSSLNIARLVEEILKSVKC
jgi:thioesterase domain-containing protein